jgi:hypothetical protein
MQVLETVVFEEKWPAREAAADILLQPDNAVSRWPANAPNARVKRFHHIYDGRSELPRSAASAKRNYAQGRKILNTVPLWSALVLLRTRSTPWCFCTVFLTSESPMPLPAAPLVVKKGSHMRARFFVVMPLPLSAKVRRNPSL